MEWVSVKERLPDIGAPVIVCREQDKGRFVVEQGYRRLNGFWKVFGANTKRVTHWMPMPEPPEAVKRDGK